MVARHLEGRKWPPTIFRTLKRQEATNESCAGHINVVFLLCEMVLLSAHAYRRSNLFRSRHQSSHPSIIRAFRFMFNLESWRLLRNLYQSFLKRQILSFVVNIVRKERIPPPSQIIISRPEQLASGKISNTIHSNRYTVVRCNKCWTANSHSKLLQTYRRYHIEKSSTKDLWKLFSLCGTNPW